MQKLLYFVHKLILQQETGHLLLKFICDFSKISSTLQLNLFGQVPEGADLNLRNGHISACHTIFPLLCQVADTQYIMFSSYNSEREMAIYSPSLFPVVCQQRRERREGRQCIVNNV